MAVESGSPTDKSGPPYSFDYMEEIVNVHWPTGEAYVLVILNYSKVARSLSPPATMSASFTYPVKGVRLLDRTIGPINRYTNANLTYWVYVSPPQPMLYWFGGVPTDVGAVVGYNSFEEFYAVYDTGVAVSGGQMRGIPPDNAFPGSTYPMNPHEQMNAFLAYTNSLPPQTTLRGNGMPYTNLQSVSHIDNSRPVSGTAQSTAYLFKVKSKEDAAQIDFRVHGAWGDPDLGSSGIIVMQVFDAKDQPKGLTRMANLVFPADEVIQNPDNPPDYRFRVKAWRPKSTGAEEDWRIEAPGLE